MIVFILINAIAREQLSKQYDDNMPFHEIVLEDDGEYNLDLDFDGIDEKIVADENSNIVVLKTDMAGRQINVSNIIPYSMIRIHRCCAAHRAYTIVNYLLHTIYVEAHYGSCEELICQYRKVGNTWKEIIPVEPLCIMQRNYLFPESPRGWVYYGSLKFWKW